MESLVSPARDKPLAPVSIASQTPLIWALQAEKAGDNAQIDTLLEAIGLPTIVCPDGNELIIANRPTVP